MSKKYVNNYGLDILKQAKPLNEVEEKVFNAILAAHLEEKTEVKINLVGEFSPGDTIRKLREWGFEVRGVEKDGGDHWIYNPHTELLIRWNFEFTKGEVVFYNIDPIAYANVKVALEYLRVNPSKENLDKLIKKSYEDYDNYFWGSDHLIKAGKEKVSHNGEAVKTTMSVEIKFIRRFKIHRGSSLF